MTTPGRRPEPPAQRGATATRAYALPFGAELQAGGGVRFRLWAPGAQRVALRLEGQARDLELQTEPGGWHQLTVQRAARGTRYRFILPDGTAVPDPASRFQPEDVHGPSEVVDPRAYQWRDLEWRGRPWHEAVVYELHVGCFTAAGTFAAALERLAHLRELGVSALELMPLADFPGGRNWGYDGVLPFAPDASYGDPQQLKALIDAAHAHGLMVLLDVVYNHFGPDGNYLPRYAPQFFSEHHHTPWGAAVNFDGEHNREVREFFIHNALYWLVEFNFDGLRLDAAHAILDDGPCHILAELAQRVRAALPARYVHLVLENEENQARWLERGEDGAPRLFSAQWNDDAHHVLHAAASGESEGYYGDYADDSERLGRALAQGFAFQGETMPYRGSARGEACTHLPPTAFVAFIQNHDQVGNRAFGERLSALAPPPAVRAITAVYLLLPQVPMLFMGEEWHSARPFQFFCDFGAELGAAVSRGRRQEFARFEAFRDESMRARIPDPQAARTFEDSKLDWAAAQAGAHALILGWYRELLAIRRRHVVPLLPGLIGAGEYRVIGTSAVLVRWQGAAAELLLMANLRDHPVAGFPSPAGALLWQEGHVEAGGVLGAWTVRWSLRASALP
ncbi:MAG TPA: malto-oligosyltrehalose trehalohydrolase [Steroidobacteraceae bacterium]